MKIRKIAIIVLLTLSMLGATFGYVLAGASFDWGDLAPAGTLPVPSAGEANWIAWTNQSIILPNTASYEILTEDNTNSDLGLNIGYSEYGDSGPNLEWWIQVEHFLFPPRYLVPTDKTYMIFGGLGPNYSGTLWKTDFSWIITESATNHDTVPISTTEAPACPTSYNPVVTSTTTTVSFWGQPGALYHIYRSMNESGAGNGSSNGQYFYLTTLLANQYGVFSYVDNVTELNWYIAVQADPTTKIPIGCHSEPAGPTAVEVADFSAVYDPEAEAVKFSWQTLSENNLVGFNIYRSETENGLQVQVNDTLIPTANPGSIDGAFYDTTKAPISLWDPEVVKEPAYYYWLEVIKVEGSPSILSTVMIPIKDNLIFVPLINR